jgi:calcineurin-like phosphoesterase family protein
MAIAGMYDLFNEKWCKQTVWLISDTHFGDAELRAGIPDRISDEELVKVINSKVGRKDTLIHLGDVGDLEYVKQLRGYKVLICGNHDAGATNYQRIRKSVCIDYGACNSRDEAIDFIEKLYPDYSKNYECDGLAGWVFNVDNHLFDEVYTGPLVVGEKLLLSHEPVDIEWAFNIHGHDHTGHGRKNHLNCCVDASMKQFGIPFEPINMNQIMKTGLTSKVESIHRLTIDTATERKAKRGNKSWKK